MSPWGHLSMEGGSQGTVDAASPESLVSGGILTSASQLKGQEGGDKSMLSQGSLQ